MKNKFILKYFLIIYIVASTVSIVNAENQIDEQKSQFRESGKLEIPTIKIPTVIEATLPKKVYQVEVFDNTSENFVPNLLITNSTQVIPTSSLITGTNTSVSKITDNNYLSFYEFNLPEEGRGKVSVTIKYPKAIKTDSVFFSLGEYVALPTKINIKALIFGEMKTIASDISPEGTMIHFPNYSSDQFVIEFEYTQPMRITEIRFNDLNEAPSTQSVRFLAEPNHTYTFFFNPQHNTYINLGESADLADNRDIIKVDNLVIGNNTNFKEADSDQDGIIDIKDNCVQVANTDQLDEDKNGRGDLCDDYDRDGVINSKDNCVNNPNTNQIDTDRDGKGDACDTEESRITEKYPVLVWIAIIFAVFVFGLMFYFVSRKKDVKVSNTIDFDQTS